MRGMSRSRARGRTRPPGPLRQDRAASWLANLMPSADAFRAPTIATISRSRIVEAPEHGDDGRRRIENGKARRELRFDGRDQPAAELRRAPRVLASSHPHRSGCATRRPHRRVVRDAALPSAPRVHRRSARSARQSSRGRCFPCAQVSARRGARSSCSVRRSSSRADPRFLRLRQAGDVGAMRDEDHDRENRCHQRGHSNVSP